MWWPILILQGVSELEIEIRIPLHSMGEDQRFFAGRDSTLSETREVQGWRSEGNTKV